MTTAAQLGRAFPEAPGSSSAAHAPRLNATLALDFSYDASSARTILSSSVQEPPLRVIRAFDNPDSSALAHLHNVSGGLLGGDQLKLAVQVGAGASAQVTTTGATRIYRPRASAPPASQTNDIHAGQNALLEYVPGAIRKGTASAVPSGSLGSGASAPEGSSALADEISCIQTNEIHVGRSGLLEYVPDAIIPFAHARFAQRTTIHLEDGAGLFWWEILAPGREARGELFEYERVELRTDIFSRGRLILGESARLEPRARRLSSLARLGPYRYCATFYICRAGLDPRECLVEEAHLRDAARALNRPGEVLWGVSALVADGLIVRGVAIRGRDLTFGLHRLWNTAKLRLFGREAIPPRKLP